MSQVRRSHPEKTYLYTNASALNQTHHLSKRIIRIISNLHIIDLVHIRLTTRAFHHDLEHIGAAHRLKGARSGYPRPRSPHITGPDDTPRRGLVGVLDLERAIAESGRSGIERRADAVVGAGTGAHGLLQGERGGAVEGGGEGVVVAGGLVFTWRDDCVGSLAGCVGHNPGREAAGFEVAVLNDGARA